MTDRAQMEWDMENDKKLEETPVRKEPVLYFKKVGTYRDGNDSGLHLECVSEDGAGRGLYQTISGGMLDESARQRLDKGESVAIPWIFEDDLLKRIGL